ncbi:hypothetical protein BCR36DRAFT_279007, partial [Piromyces finnis]
KNDAFTLALLEFIFTILGVLGVVNATSSGLSAFIILICCGLGVYGIQKDKPKVTFIYYIYIIICALIAIILFVFSFLSFSIKYIILSFIFFLISFYNWRVVSTFYYQMKNAHEEAAVVAETEAAIKT